MILQYIQNAGTDGAKRDAILEYLQGTLPSRNTKEQNQRVLGNILSEMATDGNITTRNRLWFIIHD